MTLYERKEERNIVSHMGVTILLMKLHELLEYHFTRKLDITRGISNLTELMLNLLYIFFHSSSNVIDRSASASPHGNRTLAV